MASYKLTYFNGMGRAEISRYIFAQAGVEYEDNRVTMEEFGKLKPTLPSGSLPVLEVDGKPLAGSGSIARFLGERFGLGGENDFDNAQLDSIIDVINDYSAQAFAAYTESNEEKKAAAKKALFETHLPKYFGILEKRIVANNSSDGWAYGNKITYVDLRISIRFDGMLPVNPTIADRFPAMKKLNDAVKAQPKIAEWLKKRPETPF